MCKLFYFILVSLLACNKPAGFAVARIDKKISQNPIFREMEMKKEERDLFNRDSTQKVTSLVNYCFRQATDDSLRCSGEYVCKGFFIKNDTLRVSIGLSTGFSGYGFIISYKDEKFIVESFYWDDSGSRYRSHPVFKISKQDLILDKSQYKSGDSLYGKIDFQLTEYSDGEQWEHSGQGYFRCKIDTLK